MVKKLENFDESFMCEGAHSLKTLDSVLVKVIRLKDDTASIWKSDVNERPNAIGYWIGILNPSPVCYGYLIIEKCSLPNLSGYQAVRGWIAPEIRSNGLFQLLMCEASVHGPIISDREGMTESAYKSWINAKGFDIRYYDQSKMQFVENVDVPEDEKFSESALGSRWLMVMFKH